MSFHTRLFLENLCNISQVTTKPPKAQKSWKWLFFFSEKEASTAFYMASKGVFESLQSFVYISEIEIRFGVEMGCLAIVTGACTLGRHCFSLWALRRSNSSSCIQFPKSAGTASLQSWNKNKCKTVVKLMKCTQFSARETNRHTPQSPQTGNLCTAVSVRAIYDDALITSTKTGDWTRLLCWEPEAIKMVAVKLSRHINPLSSSKGRH